MQLDFVLYDYAEAKLNASINTIGPALVSAAVKRLHTANEALAAFCTCRDLGHREKQFCSWYAMDDMHYESRIGKQGRADFVNLDFLP